MSDVVHGVGVIGLGAIGRVTLASMIDHDNFEVVCAWDPNEAACAALRDSHAEVEIAQNSDAVIGDPRTSAIYIASPPLSHGAYIRAVAAAGKCIFSEKPLGIDVADSEELVALVAARDVPNVINFNHGNATASCRVENELHSGAMGDVTGVDIFIHLTRWPRDFQAHATWLAGREQGGFTREMISHWVYLTRRLLGDGKIISRQVRFPDDPELSENRLLAELEFGGVPAVINAAVGGAGPVGTEYTLWGTKKSFKMHSGGRISAAQGGEWEPQFADIADLGQTDILRNLSAAAKSFCREPVKVPALADGLAVQRIVEALIA
jgi:predicted dehydrogenase